MPFFVFFFKEVQLHCVSIAVIYPAALLKLLSRLEEKWFMDFEQLSFSLVVYIDVLAAI